MREPSFIIFYAWQSDSPANTNRNLIESAAKSALQSIKKEGTVEPAIRLDKDTKGVAGIPDIANTILDKIRSCDLFLADVTFVGSVFDRQNENTDLIPNPNVMIELGYALSELGWERVIPVMNIHYGDQTKLPFDLRNRRWPLAYLLPPDADGALRTEEKEKLAKGLKDAIEAIANLPMREKQPTLDRRVDALEKMVATLSGNVSQYTTLAQLISGMQHVGLQSHAHVIDSKERGLDLYNAFLQRVRNASFEGFVIPQGALAFTIAPSTALEQPLDIVKNESMLVLKLRPLSAPGWDHRRYGNRFITISKWDNAVDAITEINELGIINAVGHEVIDVGRGYLPATSPQDVLFIPSVVFEKTVIETVQNYLQALHQLGAKGPWVLALGLIALQKSALYIGRPYAFGAKYFVGNDILPPPIEIPADIDLNSPQAIAKCIRPIFDYIWREHNFPQSLNYGASGDWIGQ